MEMASLGDHYPYNIARLGGKGKRKAEKGCGRGKKLSAIFPIKGKNFFACTAAAAGTEKAKSGLSPISGQQAA